MDSRTGVCRVTVSCCQQVGPGIVMALAFVYAGILLTGW